MSDEMIGQTFDRLTVVSFAGVRTRKRLWNCRCACGGRAVVSTGGLRSGNSRSCGCLKTEVHTKHGMHNTRTYRIWRAMLNRCRQSQFQKYYGDIEVCERWKTSFDMFILDMGEAPTGMSIDRKDNSKNYEPRNCRWATQTQQTRNTRRRKEYAHGGQSHSLIEWSEIIGVPYERLRGRIRDGWNFVDAISTN